MTENLKKTTASRDELEREIAERKKAEEMLDNVNKCLLSFGPDPDENIKKITETAGSILKGTCALYNKEEGPLLCTRGGWKIPKDLKRKDSKEGHICYDVIRRHKDEPFVINDLDNTPYAKTDPNVVKYKLKTYIGCAVKVAGKTVGSLCVVYQEDRTFNPNESRILSILAMALGIEEERKKAEKALRESEERYKALFESAGNGILVADIETRKFKYANPAICRMLGYSEEELKRMGVSDIHPKDALEHVISEFEAQARGEKMLAPNIPCLRKDGMIIYADINSTKALIQGRECNIGFFIDITKRKQAEERLKEAVRVKSEFTSMVSHELRTPLTAIKEGIAIVIEGLAGPINDEQKDFLDTAKRNVDRLARLINDVLDFQKLETGRMVFDIQENDINEVIKGIEKTIAPLAKGKGLNFTTKLDENLPMVRFDKDKITQVLTNLVDNAIKFTEKGSVAIITTRQENTVHVMVQDAGPGIKTEDMPKLFQSFEQFGGAGGTGLGLAISKEIVEKHRGKIWAETEFGKGSTFQFLLPIKERGD